MENITKMFATLKTDNVDFEQKFEIYFNELIDYNTKVNLTAITDKQDVYIKHFYDSCLAGTRFTDQKDEFFGLDVQSDVIEYGLAIAWVILSDTIKQYHATILT